MTLDSEATPEPVASEGPPVVRSEAGWRYDEGLRPIGQGAWSTALMLALLAGVGAWLVGEQYFEYFQPSEKAAADPYAYEALNLEMAEAGRWNGSIAFGTLGALLGLGLGVAGGLSSGSRRGSLLGGSVGLVGGLVAGVLPALVLMPWSWHHRNDDPASLDLTTPLMVHAGLWCGIGLLAGLAYGVGRFRWRLVPIAQAAIGGLLGAAVGTLAYELLGGILLPLARTNDPIAATSPARLLARLCVAVLVTLCTLYAVRRLGASRKAGQV